MAINPNTNLIRAREIEIHLTPSGEIQIKTGNQHLEGNNHTLAILDTFETYKTLREGMAALNSRAAGPQDWVLLADHIKELCKYGFLKTDHGDQGFFQPQLSSGNFGSPAVHIRMLNDKKRTDAYQKAIAERVTGKDIVLDIGTGSGILAMSAAKAGAKYVYAIERTNMGAIAQRNFEKNGLADRITLLQGDSRSIEIPEKADILLSEIMGNDPFAEGVLSTTQDAIKRLLKPGAILIPYKIEVWGIAVTIPDKVLANSVFTPEHIENWRKWYNIDFTAMQEVIHKKDHHLFVNPVQVKKWEQLSEPFLLAEVDLSTNSSTEVETSDSMVFRQSGKFNGIFVYFKIKLSTGVSLSIHPDEVDDTNHWSGFVWINTDEMQVEKGGRSSFTYKVTGGRSSFQTNQL